jgi:hypothetical protein
VRADATVAKCDALAQAMRADLAESARTTDHANSEHAASVEQKRIEASARNEMTFTQLNETVSKYVHANPGLVSCDLGDDGLRAWRAANAGQVPAFVGPDNRAGTVGALPGSSSDAGERQP